MTDAGFIPVGNQPAQEGRMSSFGLNEIDHGDDVETARTNFNACGAEVHHCRQQLELAYAALVGAAEQYGAALAREEAVRPSDSSVGGSDV